MATTTMAFSVRLEAADHEVLAGLAKIHNTTPAEMARTLILDGMQVMLDPEEIEAAIEQEKTRLLAAAEQMRKSREGLSGRGVSRAKSSPAGPNESAEF